MAAGTAIGLGLTLALGKLLGSMLYLVPHEHNGMLYGIGVRDPLLLSAATALLVCLALCGSFLPARRATQVDPVVALRQE